FVAEVGSLAIGKLHIRDACKVGVSWPTPDWPPRSSKAISADTLSFSTASWAKPNAASSGSVRLRSEEHTSELQSRVDLVCRLLLSLLSALFPYTTLFRSSLLPRSARSPLGSFISAMHAKWVSRGQHRIGLRVRPKPSVPTLYPFRLLRGPSRTLHRADQCV